MFAAFGDAHRLGEEDQMHHTMTWGDCVIAAIAAIVAILGDRFQRRRRSR